MAVSGNVTASGVLVDSSAWIQFYRADEPTIALLKPLLTAGRVVVCGQIVQEMLQEARTETMLEKIAGDLAIHRYEPEAAEDFSEAGRIYAGLRWRGITVPPPDCLIAAVAKRCGLQVCATDPHFAKIPGLRLFPI